MQVCRNAHGGAVDYEEHHRLSLAASSEHKIVHAACPSQSYSDSIRGFDIMIKHKLKRQAANIVQLRSAENDNIFGDATNIHISPMCTFCMIL